MNFMAGATSQSRRNQLLQKLGIFGLNSAISAETCTRFVDLMRNAPTERAEVLRTDQTVLVDETVRRTLSVHVADDDARSILTVLDGLTPLLSAHFAEPLTKYEPPQFLRYSPGAFFAPHKDRPRAENLETSDRKVSVVLFLNSDFEGGRLTFYELVDAPGFGGVGLPCDPVTGLAVAFRSTTLHEVTPVTSGERFTAVTWYS
jgi:predicted 2-oxoglutarate/Fe(II)-dependent dioxygenase YbiX